MQALLRSQMLRRSKYRSPALSPVFMFSGAAPYVEGFTCRTTTHAHRRGGRGQAGAMAMAGAHVVHFDSDGVGGVDLGARTLCDGGEE
jgi:hypothetical protein